MHSQLAQCVDASAIAKHEFLTRWSRRKVAIAKYWIVLEVSTIIQYHQVATENNEDKVPEEGKSNET